MLSEENKNFWIGLICFGGSFLVVVVILILIWPAKPSTTKPVQPSQALGGGSQVVVAEKPVIKPIIELSATKKFDDKKAKYAFPWM